MGLWGFLFIWIQPNNIFLVPIYRTVSSINPYWIKANNIWFFGWRTISQAFLTIPMFPMRRHACYLILPESITLMRDLSARWYVRWKSLPSEGGGGPLWSSLCNLRLIDGNCHHFVQGWATLDWGTCTSRGKIAMHNACLGLPCVVFGFWIVPLAPNNQRNKANSTMLICQGNNYLTTGVDEASDRIWSVKAMLPT